MQNPHFRYDEKNTPGQISLLLKTGGGTPSWVRTQESTGT